MVRVYEGKRPIPYIMWYCTHRKAMVQSTPQFSVLDVFCSFRNRMHLKIEIDRLKSLFNVTFYSSIWPCQLLCSSNGVTFLQQDIFQETCFSHLLYKKGLVKKKGVSLMTPVLVTNSCKAKPVTANIARRPLKSSPSAS